MSEQHPTPDPIPDLTRDLTRDPTRDGARDAAFDAQMRARLATSNGPAPDPTFRAALRSHLQQAVATSNSATSTDESAGHRRLSRQEGRGSRRRGGWPRRRTLTLGALILAGLGGGGAAVAAGVLPLPGADQVVLRAPASTVVHTGTATIDLGQRPAGTTSVELVLTCLTSGSFTFADGAGGSCSAEDIARDGGAGEIGYTLALQPEQTSTTITAAPGTRWSLTSTYSTRTSTDWAANANGDTYGVVKDDGSTPDLVAVWATNGQQGYAYNRDLNPQPMPTSPEQALAWQEAHPLAPRTIPVYTSDGVTVIGEFQTG